MHKIGDSELKSALNKYLTQRKSSTQRLDKNGNNIEWLLTFEEWFKIWIDSGYYEERGKGKNGYCMARFNDIGPYSKDNVEIIPIIKNSSDGNKGGNKTSFKKGHVPSDNNRKKCSEAALKRWEEYRKSPEKYTFTYNTVKCPHCGKEGGASAMGRWHMDNCKMKGILIN